MNAFTDSIEVDRASMVMINEMKTQENGLSLRWKIETLLIVCFSQSKTAPTQARRWELPVPILQNKDTFNFKILYSSTIGKAPSLSKTRTRSPFVEFSLILKFKTESS